MKKTLFAVGLFVISASLLMAGGGDGNNNSPVVTGPQNVTGVVQAQFGTTFGNTQVGSNVSGYGDGSFNGNDPSVVTGTANGLGSGKGTQTVAPTAVQSYATSTVSSNATLDGAGPNNVAVAGGAAQGNWVTEGSGNNFAGAYNATMGTYNGEQTVSAPTQAYGAAGATGSSTASTTQSPGMAQSQAATQGIAYGGSTVPGPSSATGYGIAAGSSMVGTVPASGSPMTGPFAGGYFQGTANANGGGQNANAAIAINGQSMGQIGSGGVSASATLTSSANGSVAPVTTPTGGH